MYNCTFIPIVVVYSPSPLYIPFSPCYTLPLPLYIASIHYIFPLPLIHCLCLYTFPPPLYIPSSFIHSLPLYTSFIHSLPLYTFPPSLYIPSLFIHSLPLYTFPPPLYIPPLYIPSPLYILLLYIFPPLYTFPPPPSAKRAFCFRVFSSFHQFLGSRKPGTWKPGNLPRINYNQV